MKNHCRPLRAYLIWGASAAAVVSALGAQAAVLGHSRVISAPNEPLRIAVQLKDLSPEEIDSLTATIAPTSAWHEAGLQAPVDLSSFRLITAAAAQPNAVQLILESSQIANQPVIDVLVDIETQVSKQRHQVSVLQAPLPAPVVLTQIADVGFQSPLAPTIASPTTARAVTKASTHRVQSGQTLSHIARRYRSDRYSDQQFMAALLELNPQAFIHGNLHLVRAGASLTIPSAEAVAAISPEQAQQIYQTHLRWFNDYKQGLAQGQPLQPLVTPSSATTQTGSVPLPSNSTPVTSSASTAEPATSSTDRLELAAEETQSEQSDQQVALAQDLAYSAQRLAEIEAPTLNETVLSSTDSSEASARAQSTVMPESMAATPNTEVGEAESGAQDASESQSWVHTYLGWALALLILVVLSITWFLRRSNTSRLDVLDELTPSAARMRDKLEKNNDNFAPQTDEVEFREIK